MLPRRNLKKKEDGPPASPQPPPTTTSKAPNLHPKEPTLRLRLKLRQGVSISTAAPPVIATTKALVPPSGSSTPEWNIVGKRPQSKRVEQKVTHILLLIANLTVIYMYIYHVFEFFFYILLFYFTFIAISGERTEESEYTHECQFGELEWTWKWVTSVAICTQESIWIRSTISWTSEGKEKVIQNYTHWSTIIYICIYTMKCVQ